MHQTAKNLSLLRNKLSKVGSLIPGSDGDDFLPRSDRFCQRWLVNQTVYFQRWTNSGFLFNMGAINNRGNLAENYLLLYD